MRGGLVLGYIVKHRVFGQGEEKLQEQIYEKTKIVDAFDNDDEKVVDRRVSTKDPVITTYSSYAKENEDIQDFTDTVEDYVPNRNEQIIENNVAQKGFWSKIANTFRRIFNKK